ncbi:hypothetical protein NQ318_021957, partial [Aromia moschata]
QKIFNITTHEVCKLSNETGNVAPDLATLLGRARQSFSRAKVFQWFKAFAEGRESIDESRSGRPSSSKTVENVDRIRDLVRSDRRLTTRMIG